MRIIRAEHLGMCFGVRDAIALAKRESEIQPLTILGELVHNETVLDDLRNRGIKIENRIANVATPTVLITAHGTAERTLNQVRERGYNILEATCPLVHFAHRSLRRLVETGCHPIIIGRREHVEVRGMTDDLAEFDVVLTESDVEKIKERPRFGVVSQTTQPIEKVHQLVELIRKKFPQSNFHFIDTVCQPTKQRQIAAIELAKKCEVVVVIGGANSNNTKELVTTCQKFCEQVYHVQSAADLRSEWFEDVENVGLTAGTSTPDSIIAEVEACLRQLTIPSGVLAI